MTRNEIRELLMQMMYEMDAARTMNLETARKLAGEKLPGKNLQRGITILTGIIEHLDEIDASINACSRSWKTNRMPKVDLAIMRLALGEIRYGGDVPRAVAINEAINLAKKYSTEQSSKFIHGVLGAVINAPEEAKPVATEDAETVEAPDAAKTEAEAKTEAAPQEQ